MDISDFKPYAIYRKNIEELTRFRKLTLISYGLAEQLLFKYPKESILPLNLKGKILEDGELFYTAADIEVVQVDEECRWVTLEEYANLIDKDLKSIEEEVTQGRIANVRSVPETGELRVIWPPEYQNKPSDELPEIGKNKYKVTYKVKAETELGFDTEDIDNFEEVQRTFLYLAHSLGEREEVNLRAMEMLNRSCFIQHWTAFESFLKESIRELFKVYPETILLGKNNKNASIKYEELYQLSEKLRKK
jgi:hypothetical protein